MGAALAASQADRPAGGTGEAPLAAHEALRRRRTGSLLRRFGGVVKSFLISLVLTVTLALAVSAQAWEGWQTDPSGVTIRWQQAGDSEDGVLIKVENASDQPYAVKFVSEDVRISRIPTFAGMSHDPTEWELGVIPPRSERVEWYTIRMIKPRRIIEISATRPSARDFHNSFYAAARGLGEGGSYQQKALGNAEKSSREYDRDYAEVLLRYLEQEVSASDRSEAVRGHSDYLKAAKEQADPRIAGLRIAEAASRPAGQPKKAARSRRPADRQDEDEPAVASGRRGATRGEQVEGEEAEPREAGGADSPAEPQQESGRDAAGEVDWQVTGAAGRPARGAQPPPEPEPAADESRPVVEWNQPSRGGQAPDLPDAAPEEPDAAVQGAMPPGAASGSGAPPPDDPSYAADPFYRNLASGIPDGDGDQGQGGVERKELHARFSDWYDSHARPALDEARLVAKETVSALYEVVEEKVMNGDDLEPREIAKESISQQLHGVADEVKGALKDLAKDTALRLYFDYSAQSKYGKSYSELDDAEKLDVHWLKAAANMIFTPVRALVTRNLEGAGDAHGTEMGFLGDIILRGFFRHDSQ